jgi:hypothetical protein
MKKNSLESFSLAANGLPDAALAALQDEAAALSESS